MKQITQYYGVELDWVELLAKQLEGKVEGNFIQVPDHIHTGNRYFLDCDFGVTALYLDVQYNSDIHFRNTSKNNDFIGFYYNLTEGDVAFESDSAACAVGKWYFNFGILDSSLDYDYTVKKGSHTFSFSIFIKREVMKKFLQNSFFLKEHVDKILDSNLNTIVKITRMSNESYNLLMNLRSKKVGGTIFDLYLKGTVQSLIADCIEKAVLDDIVIDKVKEDDLAAIIKSQHYLAANLHQVFPSIEFLAEQANMSETKYKSMFKKITGLAPNTFFLNNKLLEAKRLLKERKMTISQISAELNFTNNSYFTAKFKEAFGMLPKEFIKYL